MKNKSVFLIFVSLFLIAFISDVGACPIAYSDRDDGICVNCPIYRNDLDTNDGVILVIQDRESYQNSLDNIYENQDRYPTYDYRWGFSYRSTDDYQDRFLVDDTKVVYLNGEASYSYNDYAYQDVTSYYYEYDNYAQSYEQKTCYKSPPQNQLFYTKCPGF